MLKMSTELGTELSLQTSSSTPSVRNGISLIKTSGSVSSPTASIQGDLVGFVGFKGYDGTSPLLTGMIQGEIDGAVSTNTTPMALNFITGTTAANRTTRLSVKSDGKVNVGTTAGAARLNVFGQAANANFDNFIALFAENGITPEPSSVANTSSNKAVMVQGAGAVFYLGRDVTNDIEFAMGTSSLLVAFAGSMTNHPFQLRTNNTARMTLDTSGNVSINTTNANARLQLNGNAIIGTPNAGRSSLGLSVVTSVDNSASIVPSDANRGLHIENTSATTNASAALSFRVDATGQAAWSDMVLVKTGTNTGRLALLMQSTERVSVLSSGNVGIGTTAPTHSLTFPSTSTGIVDYNTVDQTTNYERLRIGWTANVANINTEQGGSGTARNLSIGTATRRLTIAETFGSNGAYQFAVSTGTPTAQMVVMNPSFGAGSSYQNVLAISPTISQSGTAGYTGLSMNITEATTGSGAKNLMDLQVGGTSKFLVNNLGQSVQGDYSLTSAVMHLRGGSGGNPIFQISRGSGTTPANTFDFALAGGGLSIRDVGQGLITLNSFATTGASVRLIIGQEATIGNYSNITSILSASTHAAGAGSDKNGSNLIIQSGGGTGTGTPGNIQFKTFNMVAAGTTPHTSSVNMEMFYDGYTFIANAGTVPAGTPTGGGYLYVEAGALKFKGSSGTITTLAAA